MAWYHNLIYFIFFMFIIGIILKTVVPKPFWAWLEGKIITWQLSATTKSYEITNTTGKKNKFWFLLICLIITILFWIFSGWISAILCFVFLYFVIGIILMQAGAIE